MRWQGMAYFRQGSDGGRLLTKVDYEGGFPPVVQRLKEQVESLGGTLPDSGYLSAKAQVERMKYIGTHHEFPPGWGMPNDY